VIGVTGHRDVPAAAEPQLCARFGDILEHLGRTHPSTQLLVMSALAAGADILGAEEALSRNIPVMACLPMPVERYERDFSADERTRFRATLARCWDVVIVENPADHDHTYVAAGTYIAYYAHVLVAFWDGEPGRGPGGTAEIVHLRLTGLPGAVSSGIRYVPDIGPVYHIVSPREGQVPPERCFDVIEKHPQRFRGDRSGEKDFRAALRCLDRYNCDLAHVPEAPDRDRLLALQDRTDAVANGLQSQSIRSLQRMYWTAGIAGSTQLIAAAGVPLKLALMVIAYIFFARARKEDYENRYQDYRAISEGLRVQHARCCAGMSDRLVEASYLRMQQSELQWIRLALRTAYLVQGGRDPVCDATPWHEHCKNWISGQRQYYLKAGRREQAKKKQITEITKAASISAVALVALAAVPLALAVLQGQSGHHIALQSVSLQLPHMTLLPPAWREWINTHRALLTYLAAAPLPMAGMIALLLRFYGEQRGFIENIRRYQHMYVVFDFALRRLHRIQKYKADGDPSQLIEELGREALAEHANWLVLHRERPFTFVHS